MTADAIDAEAVEELDAYHQARYQAAREAGLTRLESARFALGDTPLQTLKKLQAAGCPPATLAEIVC